jgi:5'-deoxynucleotidase YfbR-like HD superfamily hydrolase
MNDKEISTEIKEFIDKLVKDRDSLDETIQKKIDALVNGFNPEFLQAAIQYNEEYGKEVSRIVNESTAIEQKIKNRSMFWGRTKTSR